MVGMPHTTAPPSIPVALRAVQRASVPAKVTGAFLESNGIKAGEGPHMVGLLRALGFVDASSRPTDLWRAYREPSRQRTALTRAIRAAYAPLFERFEDPATRPAADLAVVVLEHTNYSAHHVNRTVESFRALCGLADAASLRHGRLSAAAPGPVRPIDAEVVLEAVSRLTVAHDESLACVRHGLLRPAHVSAWNGYVAVALSVLSSDDFARVHAIRPGWKGRTEDELAAKTPGAQLLSMVSELDLCTDDQLDQMAMLQQRRNDCAHPTSFAPSVDETWTYISDVVELAMALVRRSAL